MKRRIKGKVKVRGAGKEIRGGYTKREKKGKIGKKRRARETSSKRRKKRSRTWRRRRARCGGE